MFAFVGAFTFIGAAAFAILVMVQMVRGYWPLIVAAVHHEPLPRTTAATVHVSRRRNSPMIASTFTPRRLERERAAA